MVLSKDTEDIVGGVIGESGNSVWVDNWIRNVFIWGNMIVWLWRGGDKVGLLFLISVRR